jgi:hypothetical protein
VLWVSLLLGESSFSSVFIQTEFLNRFNPIAPTLLRKALLSLLFSIRGESTGIEKEIVDAVVEGSNGDIRSAVMGLQFAFSSLGRYGDFLFFLGI